MMDVFLLLGSNKGDRERFLADARTQISEHIGELKLKSSLYETQSWGKEDEPDYLNQVLYLQSDLTPQLILERILTIEKDLGRQRKEKYSSRTIDIDILFYGDECIEQPNLIIPHPQLHKRRFTLDPLAEIAPDWVHPLLKKTVTMLRDELDDDLNVKKI